MYLGNGIILSDDTANILSEAGYYPREGGQKGGTNGREGEREGPERSRVTS